MIENKTIEAHKAWIEFAKSNGLEMRETEMPIGNMYLIGKKACYGYIELFTSKEFLLSIARGWKKYNDNNLKDDFIAQTIAGQQATAICKEELPEFIESILSKN